MQCELPCKQPATMASWKYLPVFLMWTWVAGSINTASPSSPCENCAKKNDNLVCIISSNGVEYQLSLHLESGKLEVLCNPLVNIQNSTSVKDCSFLDVEEVEILGCPLPNASFGEVFLQLGIRPENITSLRFIDKTDGELELERWHLEGLVNLVTLEIINNNLSLLPEDLLIPTPNLRSVKFIANFFSLLPESLFFSVSNLETVHLERNRLESLPSYLFANMSRLKNVSFSNNYITEVPQQFFADTNSLENLDISNNGISRFEGDVFRGIGSLKNLTLHGNLLTALPDGIFLDLVSLEYLDLSSNLLRYFPDKTFDKLRNVKVINLRNNSLSKLPNEVFQKCRSLQTLLLSHNRLQTLQSKMFPTPETSLSYLDLGNNNLSFTRRTLKLLETQFIAAEDDFPLSSQLDLRVVLLNDNEIEFIPGAFNRLFTKLKKLDLSGNLIEYVYYHSLKFFEKSVTLNLKNNQINVIDFHERYPPIKDVILALEGNDLVCDCRLYAFSRIVQGKSVGLTEEIPNITVKDIDNVTCRDEEQRFHKLLDVDTRSLSCNVEKIFIKNCTCLWRPHDAMFIVNCDHQELKEFPAIKNPPNNISVTLNLQNNSITSLKGLKDPKFAQVVNLTLSNNRISFINESDIPRTLKILDVRGNNLTSLGEPLLKFLNDTDMILSFGKNPWHCDCDLISFLNFLHVPSRKVTDFEDIRCVDGSDSLLDLTEHSLCPFFMQPMVIVTIVAIAVFLLLFAVLGTVSFYKYKQGIKIWLFAHRFCLWAITEDEMDADKRYDAFISYSHKDEEFVNTVLVPKLEAGDPKYRICLHYRDWIPGEYIQNQILQSVEASRRTIVVLSSNFIESVWGQLEFKAAHSQALQDRTNRIIVIVYGEIPPESELDEKLQLYISMKTYIKWGDPKFWEKLRYAMPHPPHLTKRGHRRCKETDKLELVKSNSKGGA